MSALDDRLPPWSRTIDPRFTPQYDGLKQAALDFLALPAEAKRTAVEQFAKAYCFPEFNLQKASGLYIFLRVIFALPALYPKDKTKIFGGWENPSAGDGKDVFRLSWPVEIDSESLVLRIRRFEGYLGMAYQALDEYDYFARNFEFRDAKFIEELTFRGE